MVHERRTRGEQVLGVVRHSVPSGQIQALQRVVQNVHVALHVHVQQILQRLIHAGHVPGIGVELDQTLTPERVVRAIGPWRVEELCGLRICHSDIRERDLRSEKISSNSRSPTSIASKIALSL